MLPPATQRQSQDSQLTRIAFTVSPTHNSSNTAASIMSSVPSTTASIYGGSTPSKPHHSLTDPEQNSATLRASRLNSFVKETPFEGNRLAALLSTAAASPSPCGPGRSREVSNSDTKPLKSEDSNDTTDKETQVPASKTS